MVFEVVSQYQGKHVSGCEKYKGYRKDMKACITAADNYIFGLKNKSIHVIDVYIRDTWGKLLNHWTYRPTFR